MRRKKPLKFTPDVLAYPLLFVLLLWLVFWIEVRFNVNFNYLGLYPKKIEGLRGVLFAPFIHSGIEHLFNNSVPLLVLTMALFYFYRRIRWKIIIFGVLLTGILTWLIGRPAIHIGASGVVYMLTAFLFFKGIFSRQFQLIAHAARSFRRYSHSPLCRDSEPRHAGSCPATGELETHPSPRIE